jgi:uncharacterized protein YndB with AHSA1/START domain
MDTLTAKSELLINVSRQKVFAAFCDRQTICKFWLEHSSGDLAPGARVEWTFMVPGARETVDVLAFRLHDYLKFKWSDGKIVEISFADRTAHATRVSVVMSGITDADPVAVAINATEGFTIVLCDLKSLLETGVSGGMVRDKALLIADEGHSS